MDKIKSRQLGMLFTGSFLGAGFVSGQEILQFFGVFGKMGIVGMILAIILFVFFGYMFMYLAWHEKTTAIDKIILGEGDTVLHRFLNAVSLAFLFGATMIMLAGSGDLINGLIGIPAFVGSAVLTVILVFLTLKGIKGILAISQIVVPVLLGLVIVISIWSMLVFEPAKVSEMYVSDANPLLSNWFLSMLSFFSYNILGSYAVLAPAAQRVTDLRTIIKGLAQGAVQLLMMFACILMSLQRFYGRIEGANFPMEALAGQLSVVLGTVYSVLLLTAMFGGSLSCMFGAAVQLLGEGEKKKSVIVVLWVIAFACSMLGFKRLISFIFPVCGYAYLIAMPFTIRRFCIVRKKEKK